MQNLANILWAYATMDRQPSAEFLAAAERRYVALLPAFNAQGIANSLWAFAQLEYRPGVKRRSLSIWSAESAELLDACGAPKMPLIHLAGLQMLATIYKSRSNPINKDFKTRQKQLPNGCRPHAI